MFAEPRLVYPHAIQRNNALHIVFQRHYGGLADILLNIKRYDEDVEKQWSTDHYIQSVEEIQQGGVLKVGSFLLQSVLRSINHHLTVRDRRSSPKHGRCG